MDDVVAGLFGAGVMCAALLLARMHVGVPARRVEAALHARIGVIVVAVVTVLDAEIHETVAADVQLTGGETSVVILRIAVVARLIGVDDAIATPRRRAVGATSVRQLVAVSRSVIALLAQAPIDRGVPAPRDRAQPVDANRFGVISS